MKQHQVPLRISAGFVFAVMLALPNLAHSQTAFINIGANQQLIDGFGFSTAWTPAMTSAQGNVLFGTGSGQLGFSLLRIRIDPNGSWGNEPSNSSTAHSHGAKVLGSAWTPPASMKTNNSTICGDLKTSSYAAYATHLANAASAINLDYVSFQNEPDWCPNPGYESSNPTPTEILNWVLNNAPSVGKPIVVPESLGFNDSYSDPIINNGTALSHVTFIAGHFYGNGNYVHQNALNHGKRVWETEHYINGTDIGTAMTVAKEITDAMNNQFSAYFWWWIMPNDPASFINGTTVDLRGYAMGQFAHWVRPGKNRVTATYNPQSNIYVTAYHNGGIVIVALNMGGSTVNQTFTVQNASGVNSFTPIRTSSSQHMAQLGTVTVTNNTFTYSLPPQSITTFAQFP
jgi:glucuronoarabinoxylan endo-1,4-beta-xylanase